MSRTYTFTFLPQAKKVSELLKEGCGSGVFEVTHYNPFVKDSDRAEDLELCRVILQGLSMFQHLSTAWPGHTSGKALGHHWEEDLSVWWIETQDLNIFFSSNRGPQGEDVKAKGEDSVLLCVQAGACVPTEADWPLCSSTSAFWVQSESDVNWYPVP